MRRKIGPYLDSRTPVQEDAILTGRLRPFYLRGDDSGARCIMGHGGTNCSVQVGLWFDRMCQRFGGGISRLHAGDTTPAEECIAQTEAADRGAGRVGEIIRARIARNKLRRALQGVRYGDVEVESVET